MDITSIAGLIIGICAIVGVQLAESNSISTIIQPSAALVVLGGSIGAVLLNFSYPAIVTAIKSIRKVFITDKKDVLTTVRQLIELSRIARQEGLLALQETTSEIEDNFLRRGVQLIVDTNNPQLVHDVLATEIRLEEEREVSSARIFEALGGFAPTFGIIGAVLGLIQVMSNLQDPAQLGSGVATAFVSTLYGVGLANLICLPIAGKLKMRLREEIILKEMIAQGLVSIQLGENPALIEEKLLTFLNFSLRQRESLVDYQENEEVI